MTIERLNKLAAAVMRTHPEDDAVEHDKAYEEYTDALVLEYPRFRSALLAAKEWLKAADASHWTKASVSAEECQAREALREKLKEIDL